MPLLFKIVQSYFVRRWVILFALACVCLSISAEAQRHPESAGALPYYDNDPGTPREPPWKQRPPFLRGPQDRYQRGLGRSFLNAEDSVPYLNYADEKLQENASVTVARTHPPVTRPATRNLSMARSLRVLTRGVPKNMLGFSLWRRIYFLVEELPC